MFRRSLILGCFVALAAFVVLVQHDTFVRRWLVPQPAGAAKLRQVLPRVQFVDLTLPQAVEELSKLSGVAIELDPKLAERDSDVVNKWVATPRKHRLDLK